MNLLPHLLLIVGVVAGVIVGYVIGYERCNRAQDANKNSAKSKAEKILNDARQKAENSKRELLADGRNEIQKLRQEFERESKEHKLEMQRSEQRLDQKEENLNQKEANLDKKLDAVSKKEEALKEKQDAVEEKLARLSKQEEQFTQKLEEISRLSRQDAEAMLLTRIEAEASSRIGLRLKELEDKAKREADKKACSIIATALQKCNVEYTSEAVISVVTIPSEEMKGRIIGREGRNIKAFETLTGVDVIVDDTPEVVTLSSFDPVRREIARVSLERLITDGRIHPTRIEEIIEKAEKDVRQQVMETGEEAILEAGIKNIDNELVNVLGSLRFRTSYGQNVLSHSLEVAHIAGVLAQELGIDQAKARRAGLLHDIGKAVDREQEGSHAIIGADIARRHGEAPDIVNAIASHHEEIEATSIYAVIVAVADSISASRPGARRESLDAYVKRLEDLENIAKSFTGVEKAFAVQAGREVRVAISPTGIDEGSMQKLAYDIAKKIETDLCYPGQIKVTLIRETRAVEYAK